MTHDPNLALTLRYPGFRSFKATQAIHYRHRYCRVALVLDTLDESVEEIAPVSDIQTETVEEMDCTYQRKVGAQWETVCIGKRKESKLEHKFDRGLTREQIQHLPGAENAQLIWRKRNTYVTLSTRMAVLEFTSGEQPTPLGSLLRKILDAGGSEDELLALFADGTLLIDVTTTISFWTPIRRRTSQPE